MAQQYSQARKEANERYNSKTYKQITIVLRLDEDADIIEDFMQTQERGIKNREWLREMFEAYKKGI